MIRTLLFSDYSFPRNVMDNSCVKSMETLLLSILVSHGIKAQCSSHALRGGSSGVGGVLGGWTPKLHQGGGGSHYTRNLFITDVFCQVSCNKSPWF